MGDGRLSENIFDMLKAEYVKQKLTKPLKNRRLRGWESEGEEQNVSF
ncbi:MAG: hypothetical protein ACQUHE_03370 [Bacteroidia bacterium]